MPMQSKIYLILSIFLVTVGIGSALSRRNLIAVTMAICTAQIGVLVFLALLSAADQKSDVLCFAFCLAFVTIEQIVVGSVLGYRRFVSANTREIVRKNQLRF